MNQLTGNLFTLRVLTNTQRFFGYVFNKKNMRQYLDSEVYEALENVVFKNSKINRALASSTSWHERMGDI